MLVVDMVNEVVIESLARIGSEDWSSKKTRRKVTVYDVCMHTMVLYI